MNRSTPKNGLYRVSDEYGNSDVQYVHDSYMFQWGTFTFANVLSFAFDFQFLQSVPELDNLTIDEIVALLRQRYHNEKIASEQIPGIGTGWLGYQK